MCGGTVCFTLAGRRIVGLSPRVRGNRRRDDRAGIAPRSIPACAGEPAPVRGRAPWRTVYPRVCGGTSTTGVVAGDPSGLSPRVRGNQSGPQRQCRGARSIPACAGEPRRKQPGLKGVQVYPRVCGGTLLGECPRRICNGLSPRVRGNRNAAGCAAGRVGSIPACAGEPVGASGCADANAVYPRVCGGTVGPPPGRRPVYGLSPRVRGNLHLDIDAIIQAGSIPACAGEPPGDPSGQ